MSAKKAHRGIQGDPFGTLPDSSDDAEQEALGTLPKRSSSKEASAQEKPPKNSTPSKKRPRERASSRKQPEAPKVAQKSKVRVQKKPRPRTTVTMRLSLEHSDRLEDLYLQLRAKNRKLHKSDLLEQALDLLFAHHRISL